MVVCVCKAVSDKKIKALVEEGVRTVRGVVKSCRAGTDCGACLCQVREIVETSRAALEQAEAEMALPQAAGDTLQR